MGHRQVRVLLGVSPPSFQRCLRMDARSDACSDAAFMNIMVVVHRFRRRPCLMFHPSINPNPRDAPLARSPSAPMSQGSRLSCSRTMVRRVH